METETEEPTGTGVAQARPTTRCDRWRGASHLSCKRAQRCRGNTQPPAIPSTSPWVRPPLSR